MNENRDECQFQILLDEKSTNQGKSISHELDSINGNDIFCPFDLSYLRREVNHLGKSNTFKNWHNLKSWCDTKQK